MASAPHTSIDSLVIVADSTKFGRLALSRLCGLEDVARLVSDSTMPGGYRAMLEAAGVVVHTAPADEHQGSNGVVPHESTRNQSVRTEV